MTDSGSYTFNSKLLKMEPELPNDLKPVDQENELQRLLQKATKEMEQLGIKLGEAREAYELAFKQVKFYEKAIKSYNKAFKK